MAVKIPSNKLGHYCTLLKKKDKYCIFSSNNTLFVIKYFINKTYIYNN